MGEPIQEALNLAPRIFVLRGNNSEVHLKEDELAAMFTLAMREAQLAGIRIGLEAAAKFCENDMTADQQADWNKTDEALEFWLAKQIRAIDPQSLL